MNQAKYKYSPTKKVFYHKLESTPRFRDCPDCLGEGKLTNKNNAKITCQLCKGDKQISTSGRLSYIVKEGIIDSVKIEVDEDCDFVKYNIKDEEQLINASNVFSSKKQAEVALPKYTAGYTS